MSPREQKLLIFFAVAGFAIVNFLGYGFASGKRQEVNASRAQARDQLATADMFRDSRAQVTDQMEWLAKHEPEPMANQDAQTKLLELVEREARAAGLEIKSQKPLPTDAPEGRYYHRAKLQITVTGAEEALYRWFDQLNIPDQFRAATQIRLSPNAKDDTKIDCSATIEQWFIPPPTV